MEDGRVFTLRDNLTPLHNIHRVDKKTWLVAPNVDDLQKDNLTPTDGMGDAQISSYINYDKYKILCPYAVYYMLLSAERSYYPTAEGIYYLSNYFFNHMGFEERDIIELEVPDEYFITGIADPDNNLTFLVSELRKEWVVSVLRFKEHITEPVHGELSLLYENEVYKVDTYHMCYSKDIVFNGHGYGDCPECFKSSTVINSNVLYLIEVYTHSVMCLTSL